MPCRPAHDGRAPGLRERTQSPGARVLRPDGPQLGRGGRGYDRRRSTDGLHGPRACRRPGGANGAGGRARDDIRERAYRPAGRRILYLARGIAVQEAHCPAHGATVPLLPIRELLRSYFALGEGDPAETVRQGVADQLLALDAGFRDALPVVLDLLGVSDPDAPDTFPSSHDRLAGFLRRFVRLRSASEVTVLLLDDVHWIDRASDALVGELAAAARGTRTLLVANFRPEYRPTWTGGSHYHALPLSPLGREASRELLHDLLGSDKSLGDLPHLVRERTGGNPFFIEEVVQALAASGSLAGPRGAYRLAAPLATVAIPTTVQSLLAARVDRLGEEAKHVLQAAAVIGKQFDQPLLKAGAGPGDHHLPPAPGGRPGGEVFPAGQPDPRPPIPLKHPPTPER